MRGVTTAVLGALAFWAPDILVHVTIRSMFGRAEVLLITVLMPVTTLLVFARVDAAGRRTVRGWVRALLMLVGIWLFGPVFLMISATADAGGFLTPDSTAHLWWMVRYFPISTFSFATYDGALGALLLITLLLPPLAGVLHPGTDRGRERNRGAA